MVSLNTSNTMTHDDALRVKPGHRVESCGYYGTICYIGEVPPTKGIWLGVDWDDPTRGKHNGTHEAKKYFTTRYTFYKKPGGPALQIMIYLIRLQFP